MFGDRLKLARKKSGYSLRALSEALDSEVSAQALSKYERGLMMPSSNVLIRLGRVLDVSLDYLLNEQVQELHEVEFRKLSGTKARERATVEAEVISHLQRYLTIEEILELGTTIWQPPNLENRTLRSIDQAEQLAVELRAVWKLGTNPLPNMTSLLEDQGLKVLVIPLPDSVSGLTCVVHRSDDSNVPVIVVNKSHTLERRRLTLAHELAHRLIDPTSPVDHEKASTVFAGAFLIPREHIIDEIGEQRSTIGYEEIVQLKRMYRVSAVALLMRFRQIDVISDSTLTYAFKTIARTWRSNEPEPLESKAEDKGEHEVPRRFERLCYRALAEQLISPSKASELIQKPLSEIERGLTGSPSPNESHSQ